MPRFIPKDKFILTDLATGQQSTVAIRPTTGTVVKRLILAFAPGLAMMGIAAVITAAAEEAEKKDSLTEDTDMPFPNRTA